MSVRAGWGAIGGQGMAGRGKKAVGWAYLRLLYDGERVHNDDTLESLGIDEEEMRDGVEFEVLAESESTCGLDRAMTDPQ